MSYKTHNKPWRPHAGQLMVPMPIVPRTPCTCEHDASEHDEAEGCLHGWDGTVGCPCRGGTTDG